MPWQPQQVYLDVGGILYTEPRPAFYRDVEGVVEAGYGDRVMFGSDQMIWAGHHRARDRAETP